MDGNQLPLCRSKAAAHTVGAGRTALHDRAGLCAAGRNGLTLRPVAAADQHKPGDCRMRRQSITACLQNGTTVRQTKAELVKSHPAGRPRSHHNGSHGRQIHFFHGHTAPFTYV